MIHYIHTWDKPCNITAHSSAFINPHFSKALVYALLPWKEKGFKKLKKIFIIDFTIKLHFIKQFMK